MNISQIIVRPVLTEKSVRGTGVGKYTFEVHEDATKIDVKNALESLYGAKVTKVNIAKRVAKHRFGRKRNLVEKRHQSRRAIVTLKKGEKLDIGKLHSSTASKSKDKSQPKPKAK